jgi:hypothetical protein
LASLYFEDKDIPFGGKRGNNEITSRIRKVRELFLAYFRGGVWENLLVSVIFLNVNVPFLESHILNKPTPQEK